MSLTTKCTACNIVWSHLLSEEDADVCPKCKSDLNMVDAEGDGFKMCPITGRITDAKGNELPIVVPDRRVHVSYADRMLIKGMVEYKKLGTQEERDARADAIIEKHY